MPNDASEVLVASNGHIYVGALDATAPTDATTDPGVGWIDLGYASEDGVTLAPSQDVTEIMAWQEFYPIRRIVTAKSFEVSFTLRQTNSETIELAFGGGSSTGSAGVYTFSPAGAEVVDQRSMIIDVADGTRLYRIYIPVGLVTDLGEVSFNRSAAADWPITFGANAAGTSDPYTVFIADAQYPVGSGELTS